MKTIKEILNQYKETYATPETVDDAKLLKDIKSDYNSIIDLRNRIHDSTDTEPCKMYDEDHIVLDHAWFYGVSYYCDKTKKKQIQPSGNI